MAEEGSRARDLGQRAGAETQEWLPAVGDAIEGLWDGLWSLQPDGATEAYANGYAVGAFIPDAIGAIWNFLTGFFSGLFG